MSEHQRQRDLDTYRIVDSLPEAAYDDIVRLASRLCDAPIASISLVDRDRQWFKARIGLATEQTSRDIAFCDHAVREPELLFEVPDTAADERFADNPLVTGSTGLRFYAGMPLVTPNGTAVGTVCVMDRAPRQLDDAQREALASLARITMNLLESRRQLLDARREVALDTPPEAASTAACYSLVIVEIQSYAAVVQQRGHRIVENALQQCEHALERILQPGESLNRVSGAQEFVLTLEGEVPAERLRQIEQLADATASALGVHAVAAAATSGSATESPLAVFERADEELTRRKNARINLQDAEIASL
ncbi:GAF domain-containing protein [Cognatilysobacter lacus]|nr:GAF domain-containing protein [Lysobacter lacus]